MKKKINYETQQIENLIFSKDWKAIRNIYFKVCALCDIYPKYSNFCTIMRFKGLEELKDIEDKNIRFSDVDTSYLTKRLIKSFNRWKRTYLAFNEAEIMYIKKRNLGPGIQFIYNSVK